jgi:tRNA (guanine37-N1)-methyltransferase
VVLGQELVESLATRDHLVLVCGHYEGVDERFVEKHVDIEVSLGDFVLTGGELPSMILVDAVARLVPGVVGRLAAVEDDSFFRGMLDHPHFTRPAEWRGVPVPKALVSGDAAAIGKWRRDEAVSRTIGRRPDLLGCANIRPYLCKRPYMLFPGEAAGLPGVMAQLAGLARLYGLERLLVVEADETRRQDLTLTSSEVSGGGKPVFKFFKTNRQALQWVLKREGEVPLPVGVETQASARSLHWVEAKRRILETGKPIILGFSRHMPETEISLAPLRGGLESEERIDPVLILSVFVDRFFGCR